MSSNVETVITLLSPFRLSDGRIGVVKLNVKDVAIPGNINKLHENKILEIADYEIKKEAISSAKTNQANADQSAEITPNMSMSDMLKFVKGGDEKYLPLSSTTSPNAN